MVTPGSNAGKLGDTDDASGNEIPSALNRMADSCFLATHADLCRQS